MKLVKPGNLGALVAAAALANNHLLRCAILAQSVPLKAKKGRQVNKIPKEIGGDRLQKNGARFFVGVKTQAISSLQRGAGKAGAAVPAFGIGIAFLRSPWDIEKECDFAVSPEA